MPPPNPSCMRSGPLNTFKLQGVKRLIECAADRHDQIFYYLLFNLLYFLLFIINYLLLFIIYYLLFIINNNNK